MSAPYWEPGTQYNLGDVVQYEGHRYKIIQQHFSQSDWAPGPGTSALWGRLSDDDIYDQPQMAQPKQGQGYQKQPPHYDLGQHLEEKHHWYDDEENKKKLEIGGGLFAGAAALAAGAYAYKKYEEHQGDSVNAARGNWIREAKVRAAAYEQNGTNDACIWVYTQGKHIPQGAILVGKEKSWNLYICRAHYEGGLQLGKASDVFKKGGVLGYKNEEIHVDEFEVLIGDMKRLHWVPFSGKFNVASLGYKPVQAGYDTDGTPLYIAEAHHKDAVHPGKVSEKLDGAYIPYDGKEKHVGEYRVLCYTN